MKKAGYLEELDRIKREKRVEDARTVKQFVGLSFFLALILLLFGPALDIHGVKAFAYGLISLLK